MISERERTIETRETNYYLFFISSDFPQGLVMIVNAIWFSCFVTAQKFALNELKPLTVTAWNFLSMLKPGGESKKRKGDERRGG